LIAAGVIVGLAVAVAVIPGVHLVVLPWIIGVGLAKLTLLASLGLIGAGAFCQRIELREEQQAKLVQPTDRDRKKLH
jgi:hypothetical protein